MQKEHIVTLWRHEDLPGFYDDMETPGGDLFIPSRSVELTLRRTISRNTNYMLTPLEAKYLSLDERVRDVIAVEDIPPATINGYENSGDWERSYAAATSDDQNWGLYRSNVGTTPWSGSDTVTGAFNITASGKNVDVVINDGLIDKTSFGHPEFQHLDSMADYSSTAFVSDNTNGGVFDRSATVHGLKIVVAGAVGGQSAVPAAWADKVARVVTLLIDPSYPLVNPSYQANLVKTLKGDVGTVHAGLPAAQRVAYGGGSSYSPNFLTDEGIPSYSGYQAFLDAHATNDMVWYDNIQSPNPPTGDDDIAELIEHLFHTIHLFGVMGAVPGSETALNWVATNNVNWQTTDLHLAMKEAIDAGLYDPSGYATDWATVADAAEVAYKEYMYLLNWSMWDMSTFWDGGSLSPEWSDSLKTPAGMLTNNPLGHALFKLYFEPVLSKPDFAILRDILKDADAGEAYYFPSPTGASRLKPFNWFSLASELGLFVGDGYFSYDMSSIVDTTDSDHGTHVAGTAAGNRLGWAREANIYSMEASLATDRNHDGIRLASSVNFDYIRLWHRTKEINPATGKRNPTVCNNSWGQSISKASVITSGTYDGIAGFFYRGGQFQPYDDEFRDPTIAEAQARGFPMDGAGNWSFGTTSTFYVSDIEDCVSEGIIMVVSAGNSNQKQCLSGDQDYENIIYFHKDGDSSFATYYYNRIGGPEGIAGTQMITVGAFGINIDDGRSVYSNVGNAVDIFAPGDGIVSSVRAVSQATDPRDSNYVVQKKSGTSMAAPQVTGLIALLLESNPGMNQADVLDWITKNANADMMDDDGLTSGVSTDSLHGAPNKMLRWINQRPETGLGFPKVNAKARPVLGLIYPRPRIRIRG